MRTTEGTARRAPTPLRNLLETRCSPALSSDLLMVVTGKPAHGDLYLRALGRDGPALRESVEGMVDRQRRAWSLAQGCLGRYMGYPSA